MKNLPLISRIGLGLFACALLLPRVFTVPAFLQGFLMGAALCMLLLGFLPNRAKQALREKKRALFDAISHP